MVRVRRLEMKVNEMIKRLEMYRENVSFDFTISEVTEIIKAIHDMDKKIEKYEQSIIFLDEEIEMLKNERIEFATGTVGVIDNMNDLFKEMGSDYKIPLLKDSLYYRAKEILETNTL